MRIGILCAERPGEINAIDDASRCLAEALRERGHEAEIARDAAALGEYDLALVQYAPFIYGRWGFAPWLPIALFRARSRVGLIVHEPFVPLHGWRWTLMGLWQRLQLAAVRAASDVVFVTIEAWEPAMRRLGPRRPTVHLPVGSNLPDRRDARAPQERLVVAAFGPASAGRSPKHLVAAITAVAAAGHDPLLLVLGREAGPLDGLPSNVVVEAPGPLTRDALAERLAASDLFLAPFRGGVSTRRGSVMAALQHEVATVGTDGPFTDAVLRDTSGLSLVAADDVEAFAIEAAALANDPVRRRALARAGRTLYEENFDWSVLAARLLAAVEEHA